MSKKVYLYVLFPLLGVVAAFNACSKSGFNVVTSSEVSSLSLPSVSQSTGQELYANNCAACHNSLATTNRGGRTTAQISNAIATIPLMSSLKNLTAEEIQAIATALTIDSSTLACTVSSVGNSPIRRLTTNELQNSLVDLLGVNQNFVAGVDVDTPGTSGFNNDGASLSMGYLRLAKIMTAIETAVNAGMSLANSPFLKCTNNLQDANCAKVQVQTFAKRAYRRPVTTQEIDGIMSVYNSNAAGGFKVALGLSFQKILLSPNFMFLTTFSGGVTAKGKAVNLYEFASRLSFFLWNSVPDQRLLDLADQGTLKQAAIVKSEITRMLLDAKADRFLMSLFGQWLKYTNVADPNLIIRNGLSDALRADMVSETTSFLKGLVAEDKSLMNLINADYSYLNANMASHYGITGVTGADFKKVPLANSGRKGILSQASLMTAYAQVNDSRPVPRGHFLLEKFICDPPPPPPANVDTTALDSANLGNLTVRQKLEIHASNPTCAGCHAQMDPLGLAFENFDQVGKFRSTYALGKTVDATGSIYAQNFNDYLGLNAILSSQSRVRSCLATKVFSYALSRAAGNDEKCAAKTLAEAAIQDNSKFSDLIFQIISHDMFNFNVTDSN